MSNVIMFHYVCFSEIMRQFSIDDADIIATIMSGISILKLISGIC